MGTTRKSAGPALLVLLCLACSETPSSPSSAFVTPPPAPVPTTGISFVWGYVLDGDNQCLQGATVEVVDGPQAGLRIIQAFCDFDDGTGYQFREVLPYGQDVTLRGSKPGYRSQDIIITVRNGGGPVTFKLAKE